MGAALFFLAGIPAAVVLERAIATLSRSDPDAGETGSEAEPGGVPERTLLPWQRGAWPRRVRLGVAALAPLFMAAAGREFGLAQAVLVSLFILALLLCTGTDLLAFRVPNVVTYPGTALALAAAAVLPGGDPAGALVSALVGGGLFLVMAVLTRGGLGLGDVKLAMFIGAALGFPATYQALVFGVMAGGLTIVALFATGVVSRRQAVPYAPFLALAAAFVVLTRGAAFAPFS